MAKEGLCFGLPRHPDRGGFDLFAGAFAGVFSSGAFEAGGALDVHVGFDGDLAAEAGVGVGNGFGGAGIFFGLGGFFGVAGEELDSAGGAAGCSAAGVELIDLGDVDECVDEAAAGGDFELSVTFDCEFGHGQV